jgi:aryl-alcohol dehydrogenase-like predicted oxidoreductase
VSSVITGATKVAQVEENAGAGEVELSTEIVERIEQILAG